MKPWEFHIFAVIPHADQPQILLLADGTLPHFQIDSMYSSLHLLQRAIRDRYQAEMTVLRWLSQARDYTDNIIRGVWLLENHTPDWVIPDGAQWVDQAELARLELADEELHAAMEKALTNLVQPAPSQRSPWMRPGWFAQAQSWMQAVLEAHGHRLIGVPEQFKQFNISSLLRAETDAGIFYMKVALDLALFGHEPKLMQELGALFPQQIPAPLVIDAERRWMISADFGNMLRGTNPPYELLERMMQEYAALQIQTADMFDTLRQAGCHDRRLSVLSDQIDILLADDDCLIQLSPEEQQLWKASAPALKALCEKLASYAIPHTLVHGDFHAGNVALRGEDLLFFDWTDACIAHPFFDPPVMIEFDAAEYGEALEDAYLRCWTAFEPIERLREAYRIAKMLGYVHQAVSYLGIRNGMEPAELPAWDWSVPHFARLILQQL
jgi:hypothetical protein